MRHVHLGMRTLVDANSVRSDFQENNSECAVIQDQTVSGWQHGSLLWDADYAVDYLLLARRKRNSHVFALMTHQ